MPLTATAVALAFSVITGAVQPGADSLLATGVSRALATARAAQIRDVRYALSFDLTARDSSRGTVTARFRVVKPGDVILDFRGQRLGTVEVNGAALTSPHFNGAHLSIPARSIVAGENVVTMSFVTRIAAAGASIIRYRDATDGAEYLYTLLVPADANQLFRASISRISGRVSLRLRFELACCDGGASSPNTGRRTGRHGSR
jgi:aminopeptidase N